MRIIITAILVLVGAFCFAQETKVLATLSFEPNHSLPGIPVSIRVFFTNNSANPVTIPDTAKLRVITAKGESFEAITGDPDKLTSNPLPIEFQAPSARTIPAKGRIEVLFPLDTGLGSPAWFSDERLSVSGVYRFQLILDPVSNAANPSKLPYLANPIISTENTFTVDEPFGEDLLVWNMLSEFSKSKGWKAWSASRWFPYGFGLAKEIWEQHRTSNYAPYVALMVPIDNIDDQITHCELAISLYPDHPMTPYFHDSLAEKYQGEMYHALNVAHDTTLAKKFFDEREKHLHSVVEKSKNNGLKKKVEEKLKYDWEGILKAQGESEKISSN